MVLKQFVSGGTLIVAMSAAVLAQDDRSTASQREQAQARYNIFVMEGVLERAVEHGADSLRRQVRKVMPDMLLLSGAAEARGFRLDGYGVFFDIEVPVMRRSVAWSLRTMIEENGAAASSALQQLKSFVEANTPAPREKANLLQSIKLLEVQVAPTQAVQTPQQRPSNQATVPGPSRTSQRGTVSAALEPPPAEPETPAAKPESSDVALLEDPSGAYEREVISALIDAMLDHSGPIRVGPDEWLTIAARDNEHRDRLVPGDPYDLLTIVLRIKGSDLAAFRAERITRDEARKRVEVREF